LWFNRKTPAFAVGAIGRQRHVRLHARQRTKAMPSSTRKMSQNKVQFQVSMDTRVVY